MDTLVNELKTLDVEITTQRKKLSEMTSKQKKLTKQLFYPEAKPVTIAEDKKKVSTEEDKKKPNKKSHLVTFD
jgi:hypothetical protein